MGRYRYPTVIRAAAQVTGRSCAEVVDRAVDFAIQTGVEPGVILRALIFDPRVLKAVERLRGHRFGRADPLALD